MFHRERRVYDEIVASGAGANTFLLHGVTGSGKTEVYMHLIEHVRSCGKSAIMLVPEITLSMQIVDNFYRRFGSDVAILHSGQSYLTSFFRLLFVDSIRRDFLFFNYSSL